MFPSLAFLKPSLRRHALWLSVGLAFAVIGEPEPASAEPAPLIEMPAAEPVPGTADLTQTPIRRNESEASAGRARPGSMTGTLAVLGLVLGGAYVVLSLVRRRQTVQPASSDVIDVLASRRLDGQSTLHLVRIGSRVLAIGSAASSLRTLAVLDDPEEIAGLMASRDTSSRATAGWRPFGTKAAQSADSGRSSSAISELIATIEPAGSEA
ncbi:MAG: flagellar biosynthetic protein FliO [Planctomycetaceae bacterium]|nr:flagellar biosynthetic protein FliO [Planctomycetaceae bacterium]